MIAALRQRAADREDGFTLIEMLVACLLLAIVLVVLFSVILDIFRSSERTRQRSKAQRNVTLVSERLASDIEAMRAPNRNPKDTGGLEMMREAFTLSDHFWEVHDIVLADTKHLIFYAELNSVGEQGTAIDTECIEWFVAPDQAIRRRVYPYTKDCAGAVAGTGYQKDEEIVPAPDAQHATEKDFTNIFSYWVTEVPPGDDNGTCTESHLEQVPALSSTSGNAGLGDETPDTQGAFDPSIGNRAPVVVPGLGPQQLDRIVAIQLDLRSLLSLKDSRGEAHFTQKLTIPSRQQYEFRYAIGCAE